MNEEVKSNVPRETAPEVAHPAQTTPLPAPVSDAAHTDQATVVQPSQCPVQAEPPEPSAESLAQHAPAASAKSSDGTRTSEEPSQSEPPPPLAYWNGETLTGAFLGLAMLTESLSGPNELKVRKVGVGNLDSCLLVRPGQLRRLLIQHADRVLVFFDGPQANTVLCRLFATCRGMTPQKIIQLGRHVIDLSSLLTSQCMPPQPENCLPCPVGLETLVMSTVDNLPEDNTARKRLLSYYQAAQRNEQDTRLRLVVTAMATALISDLMFDGLQAKPAAAEQFQRYINKVFSNTRQVIGGRYDQRLRAIAARQRWLGNRAYWRMRRFQRRPRRRRCSDED